MQGHYRRKTAIGLFAAGMISAIILLNTAVGQSSATDEQKWPEQIVSQFHAACLKEIRRSKTKSPVVHQAVCGCQVEQMKTWLIPADTLVLLAASKGRSGLHDVVAHSRTLSRTEQRAFMERAEKYRSSTLRTCFKAGLDAALAARAIQ